MRFSHDQALVLYKTPHKDTHEWVTLFTRERGKVRALAFGAKSMTSRYRGVLETLTHVQVGFAEKDSYATINEARKLSGFHGISQQLDVSVSAFRVLELVHRLFAEEDPHPEVFDRLLGVLAMIEQGDKPQLHTVAFTVYLLSVLGYLPLFSHCSTCQEKLIEQEGFLSLSESSFHCVPCGQELHGVHVPFALLRVVSFFQQAEVDYIARVQQHKPTLDGIEQLLTQVIRHHLDRELASGRIEV